MNNLLYDDFELWLKTGIEFNKFKNKTFMVTGATGLIGSLIIKTLLYLNKEKHLNTKIIGVIRNVSKARKIYGDLTYDDKLSFTVSDLAKDKINLDEHIDFLVHAASVTTSRYLVESPVESFDVAINGTQRVLEFAKEKKVSKVIYISSMEVYGNLNLNRMATEDDLGYIDLKNVRSVYSEGKRICELLCKAYVSEYGMNIVSARLAQTFGAGILPGENRVFAQFARSIIEDKPIVLHTEGNSEGNYVYTIDAIMAIFILILKGQSGETYNIANPESHTTIREMAELVASNFSENKSKVIIDIPKDVQNYGYAPDTHLWMSIEKIKKLGWIPRNNMVDSYAKMISWMRENNI